MESDEPTPLDELSELAAAWAAARRASFPPAPWWYFLAIGALGPALILQTTGGGRSRLIGIIAFAAVLVGLLAHDRSRRSLRPRRSIRSKRQTWLFTGMIVAVIAITQLVQRAAERGYPFLLAAASFVALGATSWWFSRRIESDPDLDPGPGSSGGPGR